VCTASSSIPPVVLTSDQADSPNPSTPTLSPFNSNLSVAEGGQDDADPFEVSVRVVDRVEKALAVAVSIVPPKLDPQCANLQESPPLCGDTERTVHPDHTGADVPALGRPARHLEKPFTRGASLLFHESPRQYTLRHKVGASKPKHGASDAVFVLRSAPQILEEGSSDEESGSEGPDDGDNTSYSFPCEDSKINQLVSMLASLSLGTCPTVARPTITPTRVRARASLFAPARTPTSSPVARPSTAQRATPMEVDEGSPHLKVANKDVLHPHGIPEVMPMNGVVFYPEVRDMEMADAFAINRKLL
jgi:hypothetical protein